MQETFKIKGDHIELIKLLKATGLCATGGTAKIIIEQGQVTVDGQIELRKRCKIRPGQVVAFEGEHIMVE